MTQVAAIIPATDDEAPTVATVVATAVAAGTVDEVVVVDNHCTSATVDAARGAGARVVPCAELGKGQAMAAGVAATDAEIILFLDADLVGLEVDHVDRLVVGVDGRVGMTMGLFDRGAVQNWFYLQALPLLTGQRALWRELFEALDWEDYKGYKVEAALNSLCASLGIRTEAFVCDGLWHRTKEEKFPTPTLGFAHKQVMLLTAAWSYASFRARRLVGRRRREVAAGRHASRAHTSRAHTSNLSPGPPRP